MQAGRCIKKNINKIISSLILKLPLAKGVGGTYLAHGGRKGLLFTENAMATWGAVRFFKGCCEMLHC